MNGYPVYAADMAAAIGYGTWSAGWLCDEKSGSLQPVFGSPAMTPNGAPSYGNPGPRGGPDLAVGFAAASYFSAGNVYNVGATDDLVWAWVANLKSNPGNFATLISKGQSGFGRIVLYTDASNNIIFEAHRASDGTQIAGGQIAAAASIFADVWHVGFLAIDRAASTMRLGIQTLAGTQFLSSTVAIAASDMTTPDDLRIGVQNVPTPTNAWIAAWYVATGAGVAAGIPANMATALANFAKAINVPVPVLGTDVPDHVAAALGRLLEQDKNKTNIANLVTAFVTPAQALETALWQLLTLRAVGTAFGFQLDALGKLVNQPRNGAYDVDYVRYIKARIATNNSQGRVEDLIAIAKLVLNDSADLITIERRTVASVIVRVTGDIVPNSTAAILITFLRDAHAGGVKLTLETTPDVDTNTFFTELETFLSGSTIIGASSLPVVNTDNFPATGTLLVDCAGSYPATAVAMNTAVGYGTWGAGWLLDEISGNLSSVFGGITFNYGGGIPLYGRAGYLPDTDKSLAFQQSAGTYFTGGNNFNVSSTQDLVLAWVARHSALPTADRGIITKYSTVGGDSFWYLACNGNQNLYIACQNSSGVGKLSAAPFILNEWYVGLAFIERSTATIRVGMKSLQSSTVSLSTATAIGADAFSNTQNLTLGSLVGALDAAEFMQLAAIYVGAGVGAATNLPANFSTALSNFAAALQPNLETLAYLSKTQTSFQLLSAAAKAHASGAIIQLQTQPGQGWGDSQESAQPTLTAYANVGLIGGRMADARE